MHGAADGKGCVGAISRTHSQPKSIKPYTMCGIAGIIQSSGRPVDAAHLTAMATAMSHRGPDDAGTWQHDNTGLAHRRLSIIDIAGGHQPMISRDGRVAVVFNGEIYNHRTLRRQLENRGRVFATQCDTEVLLHLYQEYGTGMLDRLEGMFAFAVIDTAQRQLLLARDRFGQKPLFYFRHADMLAFASELQALHALPAFNRELRLQSIHDYLTYQYVPSPYTIYQHVLRLPPGSFILQDIDTSTAAEPQRYWYPRPVDSDSKAPPFPEAAKQLRELLAAAVEKRLMSDVPLGAFLSGGIDSTVITGLMAQVSRQPVRTCSIGFTDTEYDERSYAALAARHAATIHSEAIAKADDFDAVVRLVRHCGEPFADSSILPTYLLSRFTREHVTVALSGDGADELFGGYYRYTLMDSLKHMDAVPASCRRAGAAAIHALFREGANERRLTSRLRRTARTAAAPGDERYLAILSRVTEEEKQALYGPRMAAASLYSSATALFSGCSSDLECPDDGRRSALVDLHSYLPGDILTKVDTASMACSLEVRSPFLDHHVAEFALSLPWSYKQYHGTRKRILTAACQDLLPPQIRHRRKMGFGVPLAAWFRASWQPHLHDILEDDTARGRGFFRPDSVSVLISEHVSGRRDHSYLLFSLLMFELWHREFLD
jgi:asparagine synthase (glutamine-hydrolysing)